MLVPGIASAHERRTVGKYQVIVGFINEPAFTNDKNSLDFTVCEGECKYDGTGASRVLTNPVKDAQKSLKVEVISNGAAPQPLEVEARFGADGKYNGWFYPTKAGDYTFHIFGTIGNDKFDEKFTSSPKTFGQVQDAIQYPLKGGAAIDMTSTTQQIKEAKDSASTATTFGIAGIVIGLLGLALAAFAFTRKLATPETTNRETVASGSSRGPTAG